MINSQRIKITLRLTFVNAREVSKNILFDILV